MNIVGYRSPFKKKSSPAKNLALAELGLAAAPGLLTAVGSLFGASRRRREQKAANEEFQKRKQAFESIEYVNPYENLTNPYANLQNPYAENLYEDLGVNMQSANFLREQQQQSQANIMQQFRGAAGGSGVAALAQSMSNIASNQARQASVDIAKQERANEIARIRGEQQRRTGQFGVDKMKATAEFGIDKLQAKGEAIRRSQENARTQAMFGLSIDRKMAADKARQTARTQFISGVGSAAAGIAGLYAPGGMRAGKLGRDIYDLSGGNLNPGNIVEGSFENPYQMGSVYDPTKDEQGNLIPVIGEMEDATTTVYNPNINEDGSARDTLSTTTDTSGTSGNLGVNDNMSFEEAFSTARTTHGGDGGTFTWNGQVYTTDVA